MAPNHRMKLASSAIGLCGRQRATARRPVALRRRASGRSLCGVVSWQHTSHYGLLVNSIPGGDVDSSIVKGARSGIMPRAGRQSTSTPAHHSIPNESPSVLWCRPARPGIGHSTPARARGPRHRSRAGRADRACSGRGAAPPPQAREAVAQGATPPPCPAGPPADARHPGRRGRPAPAEAGSPAAPKITRSAALHSQAIPSSLPANHRVKLTGPRPRFAANQQTTARGRRGLAARAASLQLTRGR